MMRFNMIEQLESTASWDVVVLGGGAIGIGTALDAASRGYKTLLLEQYDFGKGTSSKSTKLIHGGVRYLKQGKIGFVRRALKERELLMKNAPHICHSLPFIIPTYNWWELCFYGFGMKLYDLLGGDLKFDRSKFLLKNKTLKFLPGLSSKGLHGSVCYEDGQFDDTRLCINLVQTAASKGACLINYARVTSLIKEQDRVVGVQFVDSETAKNYSVYAKVVINATGAFADEIIRMDEPKASNLVTLSQGVHIVIDNLYFPGQHALLVPRTDDGRILYAIPWHGKVLVGTTDQPVDNPVIEPRPLNEEIDFIIDHFNRYTHSGLTRENIRSVFAGLRSLVKLRGNDKTKSLSRDHTIYVSNSQLVSVLGGKWTTYRSTAQETVDKAMYVGKLPLRQCQTETIRIHASLESNEPPHHLDIYGTDATGILALQEDGYSSKINERLPYTIAEVLWMTRNEMAMTVDDILSRRTRSLFLDATASVEAAPLVASIMSKELGKSAKWEKQQIVAFTSIAANYIV